MKKKHQISGQIFVETAYSILEEGRDASIENSCSNRGRVGGKETERMFFQTEEGKGEETDKIFQIYEGRLGCWLLVSYKQTWTFRTGAEQK